MDSSNNTLNGSARRFLLIWAFSCIVLVAVAGIFNVLSDPYLLFDAPRVAGINARKPAARAQERLVKAYDVLRAAPTAAVFGSSRVDVGLDTANIPWPSGYGQVYNLGFADGGPYVAYRYLQHATSRRPLALLMLGLDFEYFLKTPGENPPAARQDFESYLTVTRDGRSNSDRGRRQALSLDGLADSAKTLIINFTDKPDSDFTVAGNWDSEINRDRDTGTGSYARAAWIDVVLLRLWSGEEKQRDSSVMEDLKAILKLCELHGTRVILFINPVHADVLEIVDVTGHWRKFEDWKRELVALTTNDTNNRIPLWDFSGYHTYATETIEPGQTLRWFWEPTHYNPELGNLILRRIFDNSYTDFGILLTPDSIEPHLATIRAQRRMYRESHPEDVQRVRGLYDLMAGRQ